MSAIAAFTFNPFQENTYVLWDEDRSCAIVDPGCHNPAEQDELAGFIEDKKLRPVLLLNTHCHVDHVLGNAFVHDRWGLSPVMHRGEVPVLESVSGYAAMMGVSYRKSPEPERFVDDGDTIKLGTSELEVLLTPGHSPAGICFYDRKAGFIVVGDALFRGSIGRTDLPGGDTRTLMESITRKLLVLPEETLVYAGHMGSTTIGEEKRNNPFVKAYEAGQLI